MPGANRYTTVNWNQPMSSYVPLPLEALSNLGAGMQQDYDNNLAETYKLNDALSLVPAIHDPQLGLSNLKKKQDLDNEFHPKVEALTVKIMAGDPTAKQELKKLERDWVNNPVRQELENSYINYKAYKEDKTKKGSKYDPLLDDYAGQQLIGEDGSLKGFRFSGMDESLDAPKRFKEIMGDIAQDIKSWDVESLGADGIKIGNKGKTAGVDERKVNDVVNNKVEIALNTDEGRQFIKKLRKVNPNISEKEILNETRKQLFSSAYEQIGSEKMSGNSVSLTDMWTRNQNKGDEEIKKRNELLGTSKEGSTFDLTKNNLPYQELKKDGFIQENQDGTLNINWSDLNTTSRPIIGYRNSMSAYNDAAIPIYGKTQTNIDKTKKLNRVVKDIAEKIGYKKEFKADNYKDIINQYNAYSKVRLADEQMTAPVSKIESEKAKRNWNNYDIIDPNTAGLPMDPKKKPTLDKDDQLVLNSWENTADGKMVRSGYIMKYDSDGTSEQIPIKVRPKTIIDDTYHDMISSLGLEAARYEVGDIKPIRTEGDGKTSPKIKVVKEVSFPGVADVEVVDINNNNKAMYHVTPHDGSPAINFGTQAEMQQYLLSKFYTNTDTGQSDAYYVAPNSETFKSTQ